MAKLIQWNMNSFNEQSEYMQRLIAREKADIICLQETNLKDNQKIKLKNFTCYNKNRLDCLAASGGVATLVKNHLYSQEIKLNTELEATAVSVAIQNKVMYLQRIPKRPNKNQYRFLERASAPATTALFAVG